jgi:cellulose synthase (UDP-forming)
MNPRLIVQLWRERWGKAEQGLAVKPYVGGKVRDWVNRIPYSKAWSVRILPSFAMFACGLFLALVCHLSFPLNGQITFAAIMIAAGMYLRRFSSPMFTLMLICLTIMCVLQYFSWRLGLTIIDQTGPAFFWAFLLGSTEVCVTFYLFIGWLLHLWPTTEDEVTIDIAESDYPSIDIFVQCTETDEAAAIKHINACAALRWPKKKIILHVSDAEKRNAIKALANDLDATYIEELTPNISNGYGEFIVLFDLKTNTLETIHPEFLEQTIGWFLNDESLSFIYDKDHFLAPKVCPTLQSREQESPQGRAILRRTSLPKVGEQSLRNFRATVWPRSALLSTQTTAENSSSSYFITRSAHSEKIVQTKKRLVSLRNLLEFYSPVAITVFLLSPLAYLFWGFKLIQAPVDWWFAMALPSVALVAMTQTKCQNRYRLGTLREIKELLLCAYFLIPTGYSFLKTKFSQPLVGITKFNSEQNLLNFTYNSISYLFFWANCLGLMLGIWSIVNILMNPPATSGSNIGWPLFYCAWALANALILLSKKAIDHEASEVRWFTNNQGKVTGAIRLAFGRLLVCETTNFPNPLLVITTPVKLAAAVGAHTPLTLYHLNRAYNLPATVQQIDGLTATLQLNLSSASDYQALKDAVFARSAAWPLWLPHKGADKPLPAWVYKAMATIPVMALDFMTNLTTFLRWDAFIKLWKK